jgi:NTP pyrophosphatase (non-canonical NTP hydrolase)
MQQRSLDLAHVNQAFRSLAAREGWQAYHTPKNLAAAVAVEAAELLEIFQWLNDEQIPALMRDTDLKTKVADEVADVTMYLIELCTRLDIDMVAAIAAKIAKNTERVNR